MKLVFIRHGESEYNTRHLLNGDPLVPVRLTERGQQQAQQAASALAIYTFNAIYVSEFQRVQHTAQLLTSRKISEFRVDPRLNDIMTGFEGRPVWYWKLQLLFRWPRRRTIRFHGGESQQDVFDRVESFVHDIQAHHSAYDELLIVGHHSTIQAALAVIDGKHSAEVNHHMVGNCVPILRKL